MDDSRKIPQKCGLIGLLLIGPLLLGAGSAEDARRVEEEKRLRLRPSEAVLERPAVPAAETDSPGVAAARFGEVLNKPFVNLDDAKNMVGLLIREPGTSPLSFSGSEEQFLTRGQLGLMLCEVLQVKGGVMRRVFPRSGRYAHKELVYHGIMRPGSSREYISGQELVVTVIEAINYVTGEGRP